MMQKLPRHLEPSTPFLNVTCKGPRAKKTEPSPVTGFTRFQDILKKTTLPDDEPQPAVQGSRGGSLRSYLMEKASKDPVEAARLAQGYAYCSLNGQGIDLSDYPVIRYCATGEIVTDESSDWFENTLQLMQRQRSELYESELMKGTPAARILERILDFNDALPKKFRDMANW